MFSEQNAKLDYEEIFDTYKEPLSQSPQLDVMFENYLALVNRLKNDLTGLREELVYHKKVHGDITDSLDEFFSIQRLSSIITQSLEVDEIVDKLDEIAQKVIPHHRSEVFLLGDLGLEPVKDKSDPDFSLLLENMKDEGILDWLWEQAHPIVVPLSDFMVSDQLHFESGSMVIAPMLQEQTGMGVYLIHTEKEQAKFSFRDLELLNILTQQAAIGIQYTLLYQKLERTHEALKRSQSRLMQTIKLATVGELAGGIAHEINNPLQIILGNVQMAMMGYKTEESLKIVESQAMRIANIVRGLLSMARQNAVSSTEYLEVNTLIVNTINLVRSQIEKRGIVINTELEEKLPVVQGSSIYFQQILLNFILHSKKQIGKNGTLSIRSSRIDDDWVKIELQDSGIPMPPEYIQKVMDPFEDMENSTEMNLGLTVSVQMLSDIGGQIEIKSGKDIGNLVTMQIPKSTKSEESYGSEAALSN
ncbi:MAG: ATP-binding protein [Calditrichia bacterium]